MHIFRIRFGNLNIVRCLAYPDCRCVDSNPSNLFDNVALSVPWLRTLQTGHGPECSILAQRLIDSPIGISADGFICRLDLLYKYRLRQ